MACLILVWIGAIAKCEVITAQHGMEFMRFEEVSKAEKFKILDYTDDFARIYCISPKRVSGNIHTFAKNNGQWVYNKWERGVWSKSGSADGFVWPYMR